MFPSIRFAAIALFVTLAATAAAVLPFATSIKGVTEEGLYATGILSAVALVSALLLYKTIWNSAVKSFLSLCAQHNVKIVTDSKASAVRGKAVWGAALFNGLIFLVLYGFLAFNIMPHVLAPKSLWGMAISIGGPALVTYIYHM